MSAVNTLFAEDALLPSGWHRDVLLQWNAVGDLCTVQPGATFAAHIPRAGGPVVSGMPNLHSHAFQRAMAGLTEILVDPADSFWSWRTLMYRFAQRLRPEHLHAVAEHLYIEMLKAGYTSVCEFHYVHHGAGGEPYDNPAELAEQVMQAAQSAGIGITMLPVLYQHSGFGQAPALPHQARFVASADWILALRQRLQASFPENGARRYGLAPHSLRAVPSGELHSVISQLHSSDPEAPVHIHIAEQTQEVEQCLAVLGQRPVQWLLDNQAVDARWCLVHATHMMAPEYDALAASGAAAGLCLTTEANLGDGLFDAQRYLAAGGRWGIGSDSNTCVNPFAELRLLEYGQRLQHRRRNVLASVDAPVVADRLFQQAVAGGAQATGRAVAGLTPGQRADFVVLDRKAPNLALCPPGLLLSAATFGEHGGNPVRDVFVGGRRVIEQGIHPHQERAGNAYRAALTELSE
jgi:formimidoylglutamate deiminase